MTDQELVQCLADAEAGDDAALRRWMDATPDEEVTKRLRNIASRAVSNRTPVWLPPFIFLTSISTIVFGILGKEVTKSWWIVLFTFVVQIPMYLTWIDQRRVRRGRSAVLSLAERDPAHAIELLVGYYESCRRSETVWKAKVEAALTDALDRALDCAEATWDQPRLYDLVEAVAYKQPLHKAKQDLPANRAYLTVAAMRLLARVGGWKNKALLLGISKEPAPDAEKLPHRRLIHDCAAQSLAPPLISPVSGTPTTALSASTPASATATASAEPQPQVIIRS